jgi:hypothetical protein
MAASSGPGKPGMRARRPWTIGLAAASVLVAACVVTGCRGAKGERRMTRRQFVNVYVQLVQARIDAAGDSVAYAAKRDRVFLDARVKPEAMRAFVESARADPTEMRVAWREIAARLDTLYGGVTTGPPPGLRDAFRTRSDTTLAGRAGAAGPPTRAHSARPAGPPGPDSSAPGKPRPALPPRSPSDHPAERPAPPPLPHP